MEIGKFLIFFKIEIIISRGLLISLFFIIPFTARWSQTKSATGGTITGLFQAGTKMGGLNKTSDIIKGIQPLVNSNCFLIKF
jgi:hypothetical protein